MSFDVKSIGANVYPHLPVWLQNQFCSFYGGHEQRVRFGKDFQVALEQLNRLEFAGESDIRRYQLEAINKLLRHAKETVPYYRDSDSYPYEVESLQQFETLPLLEKDKFRSCPEKFIADTFPSNQMVQLSTSGTTGKPVNFYRSKISIAYQWAVWSRHKQRFGVSYDDYHALFTGKPVVPGGQKKPPYWRKNSPGRQLIFGMLHTRPAAIRTIIDKLEREPVQFYTGYPSIIYQIAVTALELGLTVSNGPKIIFTGAEPLYDYQRVAIERCFNAKVTDQYGTSEGLANASRCPEGNYHVDYEFGYLEIEPDGRNEDPLVGEIIMTGFTNYAMPLIRYAVGDRGKFSEQKCSCGRHTRVISELSGRSEDFVLTPEGNRITRFDYVFKGVNGLEEAQVRQSKEGEVTVHVVTNSLFSEDEEQKIRQGIRKYVSKTITINFNYATEIPRTSCGKFRAVVNEFIRKT